MGVIVLQDVTGGESDLQASQLADNQLTIAQDVDFHRTRFCNRRNGSVVVSSGLASELNTLIVHRPNDTIGELWALNAAGVWASFDTDYTRTVHTPDPAETFTEDIATGATLHGKLFLAARTIAPSGTAVNRLHVWDGLKLRRTGLIPPSGAPVVADTGSGTYSGRRYFRTRYIVNPSGTILRRSEPSEETTFVPAGTGSGALITKQAASNPFEGETHWEVEESEDLEQGDWYRIATVAVGTTTYTDSITLPQDVPITDGSVLSADIGDYNLQASYRWVVADRDRLIGAGNFEDESQDASIEWTPVGDDVTGVGNDERRPIDTGNRLDLDGQVSGPITGLFSYDGRIIVQKLHRTYELTHTGIRSSAYLPRVLSNTYGSLAYSGVEGVDADGRPVLYFVDRNLGPMALTPNGFRVLAPHLLDKFRSEVNFDALHIVNGTYHAPRGQVWWHFAGVRRLGRGCCPPAETLPDWPSFRWVYDVKTGGSSFHSLPRLCRSSAFWPDKPLVTAEGGGLVRCDEDDATDDYSFPFRAYVRTRALMLGADAGSTLSRFAVTGASVDGRSAQLSPERRLNCLTPSGVTLAITMIRDYGKERQTRSFVLDQEGREDYEIVPVDDSRMGECTALQVEIGDEEAVSQSPWVLYRVALRTKGNGSNIS